MATTTDPTTPSIPDPSSTTDPTSTSPSTRTSSTHRKSSSSSSSSSSQSDRLSTLLSSPTFTPASYLNVALPPSTTEIDTQRRMAELALQLQLQTQKCHDEIGRIGAELQAILPRCTADVSRLGVGLRGMKEDALALRKDTEVERRGEAAEALETLSTLHSLRLNLSLTKSILSATSSWDATITSIPTLLSEQKLTEAVTALTELERGERALRGMPGKETRVEMIGKYRAQILSILKPQLLHALQKMDTRIGLLQQCVGMYRKLGKVEEMQDEYVKFRPGEVHKGWFAFLHGGKDEFVDWLGGWFGTVLSLLEEERTKSGVVFGKECASDITTMVLSECFRPILSSFHTRLSALCPSTPPVARNKDESQILQGSLATIASSYQSTLQFISLAYNHLINDSPTFDHQKKIHNVLITIASPFKSYQLHYPQLERLHSFTTAQPIIKSIQESTRDTQTIDLSQLQNTLEKLQQNSPAIFSLASDALQRYTLLNAGYNPKPALKAMNKILENHISELTIAINRLSATISTETQKLADKFDEQMVQTVLEVLKMSGGFQKLLKQLEDGTRDEFKALCGRMAAWFEVNHLVIEDEGLRELTTTDVTDMISREVLCDKGGQKMESCIVELQMLSGAVLEEGKDPELFFRTTKEVFGNLKTACHLFVFDVCSFIPMMSLKMMSGLKVWNETDDEDDEEDDLGDEVGEEAYSILPQQYITQIGEHMLALVQALEPFAANKEALDLANEVMGGIKESVSLKYLIEFLSAIDINTDNADSHLSKLLINNKEFAIIINSDEQHHIDDGSDDEETPSTLFCNEWLDVISTAITGKLLERIARIPQLSKKGCEHLAADLNYLGNVLLALGVVGHPHPIVGYVSRLVMMPEPELIVLVAQDPKGGELGKVVKALEKRIARMRGCVFKAFGKR